MKLSLDKILDNLDSIPLSVSQFKNIANVNSFMTYDDLLKYNSFEQLFETMGDKILIIIKATKNFGHFACLFKQSSNQCSWYESYGINFQDIIKHFPYTSKIIQGIDPLKKLEISSKIKLDRNTHRHQEKDTLNDPRQTCGYHCATRLRYSFVSNDDYHSFIMSTGIKPDDFVILTNLNKALDLNIL